MTHQVAAATRKKLGADRFTKEGVVYIMGPDGFIRRKTESRTADGGEEERAGDDGGDGDDNSNSTSSGDQSDVAGGEVGGFSISSAAVAETSGAINGNGASGSFARNVGVNGASTAADEPSGGGVLPPARALDFANIGASPKLGRAKTSGDVSAARTRPSPSGESLAVLSSCPGAVDVSAARTRPSPSGESLAVLSSCPGAVDVSDPRTFDSPLATPIKARGGGGAGGGGAGVDSPSGVDATVVVEVEPIVHQGVTWLLSRADGNVYVC
jgi:hypothetical protein